jgi:hypothetical protein
MRRAAIALALAVLAFLLGFLSAGCSSRGLDGNTVVGSWQLTTADATAVYTFDADARFMFDGRSDAGQVHLDGAWTVEGAMLTIAADGHQSATVPYALDGDTLAITDDPATVAVGTHATAVYMRRRD